MSVLFDYPQQARFGRRVPKSKFYEKATVNSKLKEKFINQIEKIVWSYKLAPETINLAATAAVPEIEIFDIHLKAGAGAEEIDQAILELIDKAIPLPILYRIHREGEIKMVAAYKRPSEADATKWVVERYLVGEWLDAETEKQPLPVALDLGGLYEQLLQTLMPPEMAANATAMEIGEQINQVGRIQIAERKIEKLQQRMRRERQFNRKAELNRELKTLKQQLQKIKGNG